MNNQTIHDDYIEIEKFVEVSPPKVIREKYNEAQRSSEKASWSMAIQTFIAIGLREDLEEEFPEYKGANPKHSFPSLSK